MPYVSLCVTVFFGLIFFQNQNSLKAKSLYFHISIFSQYFLRNNANILLITYDGIK